MFIDLVFIEILINEFVLALFLERDNDQSYEDVHKKERKDNKVNDIEDGCLHAV